MGVQNKEGALYWATGIDNSGLKQDADEAKGIVKGMSSDMTKTSASTSEAIDKIGKTAIESAKSQILAQKEIIKQIETDIKGIEKQAATAAPGNAKSALLDEVNMAKRALSEEKAVLAGLEAQVNSVGASHVRLRTQIMNVKDELSQMEMAGKRGTVEYGVLQKKLGELNDQFKDTAAQATILADDQKGFKAVTQLASGMAGAFSAATGVMAIFGSENEELAKVQARLQAVMAITIGLQQVSETLNKDQYVSVHLVSKAKEMWAVANLKVATTLGITTVQAQILMATLTLGLSVAITAVVAGLAIFISKQQETAKAAKDFNKKVADSIGEPIAKIKLLSDQWTALGGNLKDKQKFIDDNKDSFKALGVEVNNVKDAENLLVANKDNFINAIIAKAKAAASMELASQKYKEAMLKMLEADKMADTVTLVTGGSQSLTGGGSMQTTTVKNSTKIKAKADADALLADGDKFIKDSNKQNEQYLASLKKAGIQQVEDGKKIKKVAQKEVYDSEKAITDLLLDIRAKRAKLEIDQQTDSLQKRINGIRLERDEEIRQINDKEAGILAAYNKNRKGEKGFVAKTSIAEINPDLAKQLGAERLQIVAEFGKKEVSETEKYQKELSDIIFQYADERTQLAYNYNKDIEEARKLGLNEWADDMEREKQKKISDISLGLIEETDLYKAATDDKLQLSRETTDKLIADLKRLIDAEIAAGDLTKDEGEKWLRDLDKTQQAISDKRNQNNPFAQLSSAIKGNSAANKAFESGKLDPKKTTEELAKLESAAADATQAMAAAAGAALMGVQDILNSVVGGLDQLGMLTDEQKKDADNVMGMVGGAANLAMGIATGNPMQIIQGSVDLLVNGYKLLDFEGKKVAENIENNKKKIEALTESYNNLADAISRAYGSGKANLIDKQNKDLADQRKLIEENIAAEKKKDADAKKKLKLGAEDYFTGGLSLVWKGAAYLLSDKTDTKALEEYNEQLKEIAKLEEENRIARIEALTGTSVMSAIDEFANAYADAFISGEDAALKSANVIKNLLKTALIEGLKNDLKPGITELMAMIGTAMEDGILSADEKARIEIKKKELDATAKRKQDAFQELGLNEDSKKSGVTGELQSQMTEGTGSQLVGLWNMTAMDIRWIREWLASMSNGSNTAISNDVGAQLNTIISNTWLIQQHTLRSADSTEYIASVIGQLLNKNNSLAYNKSRDKEL